MYDPMPKWWRAKQTRFWEQYEDCPKCGRLTGEFCINLVRTRLQLWQRELTSVHKERQKRDTRS